MVDTLDGETYHSAMPARHFMEKFLCLGFDSAEPCPFEARYPFVATAKAPKARMSGSQVLGRPVSLAFKGDIHVARSHAVFSKQMLGRVGTACGVAASSASISEAAD